MQSILTTFLLLSITNIEIVEINTSFLQIQDNF